MRARLGNALVAVCLAVAGCSDDADGQETGPTLPPVTEAPSPSPSPEAIPTEATEATPEGAAEFAKHFAAEVHQAYLTLDPERVERLSAPSCQACQGYIQSIKEIQAVGGTIAESYTVEVLDAQAPRLGPNASSARVTVFLRIGEFVLTGADGAEILREPADDQAVQEIELARSENGWVVTEVSRD